MSSKNKKELSRVRQYTHVCQRKTPEWNYMKFWRPIKYWALNKYKLSSAELDMLFFLHGEGLFSRGDFDEFGSLLPWDKKRFNKMLREGWINKFRDENRARKEKALYEISFKGKRAVDTIYKYLNGNQIISEGPDMFTGSNSYSDKVYRNFIRNLNSEFKELRRRQSNLTPRED